MKKAWAFYRRSTNMQEVSLEDQQAACRAKAAEIGCAITREFAPAKGYASGLTIEQDSTFQEMVRAAEAGAHGVSYLIIYSVSRFGRVSPEAKIYWEQRFKKQGGIQIVYVKDDFKNDGSIEDVLLKAVKHSEAHQYSVRLSQDTLRGAKTHASRGKSCGGRAPFGYDRMLVDSHGSHVKRLGSGEHKADKLQRIIWVPGSPEKVKLVLTMFEMYARGAGLRGIAAYLNGNNIPSATGGKWGKLMIHYLLCNAAYIGTRTYNKRAYHDRSGTLSPGAVKPREDWVVCENAHEPIVPKELFLAVQAKMGARRFAHAAASRPKPWLLSGLVVCAECGHRFHGIRRVRNGAERHFYTCGGYVSKGSEVCRSIHIPREALDGFVIETIRKWIGSDEWRAKLRERLRAAADAELREKPGITVADVEQALARNQKQINNLLDAIKSGLLSPHIREELDRLEQQRRNLAQEKQALLQRQSVQVDLERMVEETLDILKDFEDVIAQGTNEQKKVFLRAFLYETKVSHADGDRAEATHYFHEVPRPEKEVTEGRHPNLAVTFGDSYVLSNMVAGAGFEPATSRL